jgi:hypothetical protein
MTFEEKNTWIYGAIAVIGYAVYLALVLPGAETPLESTPYVVPMLATIGGAIIAGILGGITLGMLSRRDGHEKDERDRQIQRFGDYVGNSFVVAGALAALLLAIVEADHFWIANAVYLAFVLSAVLSSVARLAAYRWGIPSW